MLIPSAVRISQALRNTKLLAAYTRVDPRVPELGCALKRLAKVIVRVHALFEAGAGGLCMHSRHFGMILR